VNFEMGKSGAYVYIVQPVKMMSFRLRIKRLAKSEDRKSRNYSFCQLNYAKN